MTELRDAKLQMIDEAIRQAAFAACFKSARQALVDAIAGAHEGAAAALEANGYSETDEMGQVVGQALGVAIRRAIEDVGDGTAINPVLVDVRATAHRHVEAAVSGVLSGGRMLRFRLARDEAHGAGATSTTIEKAP
jgi:hypothetical protein